MFSPDDELIQPISGSRPLKAGSWFLKGESTDTELNEFEIDSLARKFEIDSLKCI